MSRARLMHQLIAQLRSRKRPTTWYVFHVTTDEDIAQASMGSHQITMMSFEDRQTVRKAFETMRQLKMQTSTTVVAMKTDTSS